MKNPNLFTIGEIEQLARSLPESTDAAATFNLLRQLRACLDAMQVQQRRYEVAQVQAIVRERPRLLSRRMSRSWDNEVLDEIVLVDQDSL